LAIVAGCALLVAAPSLGNGFAFDDVFIIRDNSRIHTLHAPWTYATEPFWYEHYCCAMHRPLTIWAFAMQWAIGGGDPLAYHVVNVVLYVATCLTILLLLREVASRSAALVGAMLYAVHPVHVEAVANGVGQAELWVGFFAASAVALYIRSRVQGPFSRLRQATLLALVAAGCLSKEQGFVVPLLLVAVEYLIVRKHRPWRDSVETLRPFALAVVLVVAAIVLLRFRVLGGLGGGPPFIVLRDLDSTQRVAAVLGLVPEWARLLIWPWRLQADYGPPALGAATWTSMRAVTGAILLLGTIVLAVRSARADGRVSFGITWLLLAMLPASNLLFPTGVLVAERTLYLPSVGLAIGVAGFWHWLTRRDTTRLAVAVGSLLLVLAGAGAFRSATRQRVWSDNYSLFASMIRDAPDNYRGYRNFARHLVTEDRAERAVAYFRMAHELYPADPQVAEDLAQLLRQQGRCEEAVPILLSALSQHPTQVRARAQAYHCLLETGNIAGARAVANDGANLGDTEFEKLRARADSLLRTSQRRSP
jgi:hypothetical protein